MGVGGGRRPAEDHALDGEEDSDGAAACYRDSIHMRVRFFVGLMPPAAQRALAILSETLVAVIGVFMAIWGEGLCEATWYSSIDAFPALSVGLTYLPIPLAGFITFLFVVERVTIGSPPAGSDAHGSVAVD